MLSIVCPMVDFDINVVDTSYSLVRVLIYDNECH